MSDSLAEIATIVGILVATLPFARVIRILTAQVRRAEDRASLAVLEASVARAQVRKNLIEDELRRVETLPAWRSYRDAAALLAEIAARDATADELRAQTDLVSATLETRRLGADKNPQG